MKFPGLLEVQIEPFRPVGHLDCNLERGRRV